MKILLVNKFLYPNGGSETYIFELGKELVRQGHEVQYFGMEHEGSPVPCGHYPWQWHWRRTDSADYIQNEVKNKQERYPVWISLLFSYAIMIPYQRD